MTKYINSYELKNQTKLVPMEINKFYDQQIDLLKKTGKIDKMVDIIQVLLFNDYWEIILQKNLKPKDTMQIWYINLYDDI